MKRNLTLRLALLVGLLGLVQAAGVLAFSYFAFSNELGAQERALLQDKLEQTRELIATLPDAAALKDNAYRLFELVKEQPDLNIAVALIDSGAVQVAFSPEATESLQRLKQDVWGTDAYLEWQAAGGSPSMLSLASTARTKDGQVHEVVLSVDRAQSRAILRQLLLTALTAAPFALAGVMLAAAAVVGIGLSPLRRLSRAVSRVNARQLDERLDPVDLPRELVEFAEAFNAMLDRLGDSVTRLSQFSADLAHEMRTPLATLLARTQIVLSQHRNPEELADVLVQNVEEVQRLSRLVTDMLFLAQADQARQALQVEHVDAGAEARRVAEFLSLGAEERGLSFRVHGAGSALADRGLLQRALTNLMANAVRHARRDSVISVEIESRSQGTSIAVENVGEEIPREHLDRLFERFYRADPARQREAGGTGLGLSIVQAIMTLHGGKADASLPAPGRVRFTLYFRDPPEHADVSARGLPVQAHP